MKTKLIIIVITFLFFGCPKKVVINLEADKKAVISRVEQFHQMYNEENFEQIVDGIWNSDFIKWNGRKKVIEYYKSFYYKYGKITSIENSSNIQYLTNGGQDNRYMFIVYQVNFENGSNFIEKFVFSLSPEVPEITTHHILNDDHKFVLIL